jgi:AcrR family transcriptional regulator
MNDSRTTQSAAEKLETPHYHHGDLKNALIKAGLQLLVEKGVNGLNLREVARRAGVTHAAPYRHFADKEALIAAMAEEGFQRLAQQIGAASTTAPQSATEKLIALGDAYIRFAVEQPDSFRLMFSYTIARRAQYPTLYTAAKRGFHLLESIIEDGQAAGEFLLEDSTALTKSVWSMMHGLATLLVEGQFPADQADPHMQQQTIRFHLARVLAAIQR